MKLNISIFLKLLFDAKKQGKGRIGRGKVYTRLIEIISGEDNFVSYSAFGGNYGDNIIDKAVLHGSSIHPKQVCVEALLFALLYHVHKYPSIENSDSISLTDIPDIELNEYGDIDASIKSLLKLPPLLNVFKSRKYTTAGELLEYYFMQYEMSRYSDNTAASFMIEIVLPFIAKRMKDFPAIPLKCSDVFEIMGTVTKLMLNNDSVYLNYIVPKGYNEESLPTGRDELINIILETGIIIFDEDGALSFETSIYRDYFAAKYAINVIEMLDISFGKGDVDFSDTTLPLSIPSYIKFSDKDGELPCIFINCQVMFINLLKALKFSVRSDNNKYILAAFENAYFVLWDTENEQIVWDNELSE